MMFEWNIIQRKDCYFLQWKRKKVPLHGFNHILTKLWLESFLSNSKICSLKILVGKELNS